MKLPSETKLSVQSALICSTLDKDKVWFSGECYLYVLLLARQTGAGEVSTKGTTARLHPYIVSK